MARHLSGDDAQSFIDMIDEVGPHKISRPKDKSIDLNLDLPILSLRCWIASHRRSAQVACTIYTVFVAAKAYFQDHWKSHFAMTQRNTHCVLVDLRTCGRVSAAAGRSQPGF
jgi:hypothetical protein